MSPEGVQRGVTWIWSVYFFRQYIKDLNDLQRKSVKRMDRMLRKKSDYILVVTYVSLRILDRIVFWYHNFAGNLKHEGGGGAYFRTRDFRFLRDFNANKVCCCSVHFHWAFEWNFCFYLWCSIISLSIINSLNSWVVYVSRFAHFIQYSMLSFSCTSISKEYKSRAFEIW